MKKYLVAMSAPIRKSNDVATVIPGQLSEVIDGSKAMKADLSKMMTGAKYPITFWMPYPVEVNEDYVPIRGGSDRERDNGKRSCHSK